MQGTIKSISFEKRIGVIALPDGSGELKFDLNDYKGQQLVAGDKVEFKPYMPQIGILSAKNVTLLEEALKPIAQSRPGQPQHPNRRYYGKPTKVKGSVSGAVGGSAMGLMLGAALGPVGAIFGGLIGAAAGGESRNLTSTCLRCSGTGHVTAIDDDHIGFQC